MSEAQVHALVNPPRFKRFHDTVSKVALLSSVVSYPFDTQSFLLAYPHPLSQFFLNHLGIFGLFFLVQQPPYSRYGPQ